MRRIFFHSMLIGIVFFIGAFVGWRIGPQVTSRRWVGRIQSILTECQTAKGQRNFVCLRREFGPLVTPVHIKNIMTALEQVMQPTNVVLGKEQSSVLCHDIGHIIGEEAGARGGDIPKLLSACGPSCGYGCAHGVFVGLLRKDPQALNAIDRICTASARGAHTHADIIACYHGAGHVFAEYEKLDMSRAVGRCDSLQDDSSKQECATGVFMELFDPPTKEHAPVVLSTQAAHCLQLPDFARPVCLGAIASQEYRVSADIARGFAFCSQLSGVLFEDCILSIGSQVYYVEEGAPARIVQTCHSDSRFFITCIHGALVSSLIIDASGRNGGAICDLMPEGQDGSCRTTLAKEKQNMSNNSTR